MGSREKQVVRIGMLNMAVNLALAVLKVVVGTITNSIAIILDGVNSLTDGLASVVTIIGTKLAGRPANREHPYGYGRVEYLTSIVIAAMIIAAGASSLISAIQAIIAGEVSTYSVVPLILVGVGCAAKGLLGVYTRKQGEALGSDPLVANGSDSMLDAVVSASTLVAALCNVFFHISVESWLAAGISILIIKNGFAVLMDTLSHLLGERQDPEIASKVEDVARTVEGVSFVSNLVLLDFGPETLAGSLQVTVDEDMTVADFNVVSREVQRKAFQELGVRLTAVGAYPAPSDSADTRKARSKVAAVVWGHDKVMETRGLYVNTERKLCSFDAVVDFSVADPTQVRNELVRGVEEALPGYQVEARVIKDVAD